MQPVISSYLCVGRIVADRWLRPHLMKATTVKRLNPDRREETN